MAKKLKDVNKDGKINFKDTWLGERLSTKGKLKGPNLAESMKGARRESDTPVTKSKPASKATSKSPAPTTSIRPKSKPVDSGSRVGAKDRPVKTVAELRAAKLETLGGRGDGASEMARRRNNRTASASAGPGNTPERPVSPTPYKDPKAILRAQTARLGNITEAQWDKMTREERRAKGLPESWVDWVKAGGRATVKPSELKNMVKVRAGYGSHYKSQTYSKGGMTKGKK